MENTRTTYALDDGRLTDLREFELQHGVKITASAGDHISKAFHEGLFYEGAMLQYILNTYPEGMHVVDVGAHIGNHSLFFHQVCKAEKVLAIEPQEGLFDLLEHNRELNGICRCSFTTYYAAAGSERGWVDAVPWPKENTGMGRVSKIGSAVVDTWDPQRMDDAVPMERLDYLMILQGWTRLDLLKIDAEGMELDVLRGARDSIERYRPAIFIECQTEPDRLAVFTELHPLGYVQKNQFNHTPTYEFVCKNRP